MNTLDWQVEEGGTLGDGGEHTPVQFPRSGDDNDIGMMNKGGASQSDGINNSVRVNNTGDISVPRHADTPIDYEDDGDGSDGYTKSNPYKSAGGSADSSDI